MCFKNRILFILLILTSTVSIAQATIFTEDFETQPPAIDWISTVSNANPGTYISTGAVINGSYALRVDENPGETATSEAYDVSSYATLEFSFKFRTYELSKNALNIDDDLDVLYYNGAAWNTVRSYTIDSVAYKNNTVYNAKIVINNTSNVFPTDAKFRFRSNSTDADNTGRIIIDDVSLVGYLPGPGGNTNNLQVWLKADKGVINTGTGVEAVSGDAANTWQDQSGARTNNADDANLTPPTFRDNAGNNINFNPVLDFNGTNNGLDFGNDYIYSSGIGTEDGMTWFVIVEPDDTSSASPPKIKQYLFDMGRYTANGYGVFYGDTEIGMYMPSSVLSNTSLKGTQPVINRTFIDLIGSDESLYLDGTFVKNKSFASTITQITSAEINVSSTHDTNAGPFTIGQQSKTGGITNDSGRFLDGSIAEIIGFNKVLSATETQKIESYLALKYGITLNQNTTVNVAESDYLDSAGSVIWSVSDTLNYHVAGIGRDDVSGLYQKQSKTINTADDITIGLGDITSKNSNNTNTFTDDRTFVVWGNNNGSTSTIDSISVNLSSGLVGITTNTHFKSMQRVWKVSQTGSFEDTEISIPASMLTSLAAVIGTEEYAMFVSDAPKFDTDAEYYPLTLNGAGTDYETNVTFRGDQYIRFGFAPIIDYTGNGRGVIFDGINDFLYVGDKLDLDNGAYTISAWIKRDASSSFPESIISKRDGGVGYSNYYNGFDLRINTGDKLRFVWRKDTQIQSEGSLNSSTPIPKGNWHHVAVVFDGVSVKMYIDGVLDAQKGDATTPATGPENNTNDFLIGAAGVITGRNQFFNGSIDEIRIWKDALEVEELRFLMNQEIEKLSAGVKGFEVKAGLLKDEVEDILYSDLLAYYSVTEFKFTNIVDKSGYGNLAAIKNINTLDLQKAPVPYFTAQDGDWDDPLTWMHGSEIELPNTYSITDGTTLIDWNLIRVQHNVSIDTYASFGREVTLLGLIIDRNILKIEGNTTLDYDSESTGTGNSINVTHFLKIRRSNGTDGVLDLDGASQLIQPLNSDYGNLSGGYIEVDQQGIGNRYRYNDWSSPVTVVGGTTDNTSPYAIEDVLYDGTNPSSPGPITYTGDYDGATSPLTLSTYWMNKYANNPDGDYSEWEHIGSTGDIYPGEGFLMKGTKPSGSLDQNYVFRGKPNNGVIELTVTDGYDYLVGNPYPSALDANQFLIDNGPSGTNSIEGVIHFWEHYGGDSHLLREYQAGYATYNFSGAVQGASPHPDVNSTAPTSPKVPKRYIPVGQGFFVVGENSGTGTILFNNGQRIYETEASGNSIFMKSTQSKLSKAKVVSSEDTRPKFRIGFNAGEIDHRQILLTIDDAATDTVDWGYDAKIYETLNDDMYWVINNDNYVIQAINSTNYEDKEIPLGIRSLNGGEVTIKVDKLENVDVDVYIKDNETGLTHNIKTEEFKIILAPNSNNSNRFSIVFKPENALNVDTELSNGFAVFYNNTEDNIEIHNQNSIIINKVELFNMLGQQVKLWDNQLETSIIKLPTSSFNGVYIIKTSTAKGVITEKVLITS